MCIYIYIYICFFHRIQCGLVYWHIPVSVRCSTSLIFSCVVSTLHAASSNTHTPDPSLIPEQPPCECVCVCAYVHVSVHAFNDTFMWFE